MNIYFLITKKTFLLGSGDLIQQNLKIVKRKQQSVDIARTGQMTCTGISTGVLCHFW